MWLKGVSRDQIASNLGIGGGSVSRIIADFKKTDIPDIDLLRQVAIKIKNEGFLLTEVASGINLSNFLKRMGSSVEDMEPLFSMMEIYCFKTEQDFHNFIDVVKKIQDFEVDFGISIHEIPDLLERKKQELNELENEILRKTLFS